MAVTDTNVLQMTSTASWRQRIKEARLPWVPMAIIILVLILGIFSELIAPFDPEASNLKARVIPPFTNGQYILGTDILGKDIFSRLVFGARTLLQVTVPAMAIAVLVGTAIGLVAGYSGRWLDAILMRITDATLGFPSILVAMLIVTLIGTGVWGVVFAVTATTWARFARMIRGEVLGTKERDFVLLAKILGVSPTTIMLRHLFPNVINTLMVMISLTIGQVILLEASLSFLGLGMKPGEPAWGIMVAEGRAQLLTVWWLALLPGIMITIVVMACNFFGDWLRDYLDPKLRRSR
ncbi:MAG: ABC transporter permease [SAR202 cluster bacterium]|nr:MAG: ABC transporter permease [SAR202 cluster bacterium]MCH2525988.1 ABC transporter permease [Dehalococcoidia bacterium]MQG80597.1 ABC transporter permease [SAR202 cluster bacterium]GIS82232.1 MAG: peptide ABC transporter permease [Dehalococcoidia bacterium]